MDGHQQYGISIIYDPAKSAEQAAGNAPIFDLVAIHGINGDAVSTWTDKTTGVMWLRDLLPQQFPKIRILTFAYNAKFASIASRQNLRTIATKLLTQLAERRTDIQEKSRPIVLVCHSLGGIVAKKALLLGCPPDQEQIQKSVFGIIFLGTPHRGSTLAGLGFSIANIVNALSPLRLETSRELLRTLQVDSEMLTEMHLDFIWRYNKIQITSFYETRMTRVGPLSKTIVEEQSAILAMPNETAIGQDSDHRELARFRSAEDRGYRSFVSRLHSLEVLVSSSSRPSPFPQKETSPPNEVAGQSGLYEVPKPLTDWFCGRRDVLQILREFFFAENTRSPSQLSFAICGLSGSGKSQTAIRFAQMYRVQYRTAIIILNARSQASLNSGFEEVFDALQLSHSSNKADSVKRWLSRSENRDWLLVFDDADDLQSWSIQKYFPNVPWGHIILTTQNQAARGTITMDGCTLEPLTPDDAISLLFKRSGMNKDPDAITDARDIVASLGCLPMAVDQAGAMIRTSHKSFAEYKELLKKHVVSTLARSLNVAMPQNSIISAWNVNLEQLEQSSEDATVLLLLFCFLDPSHISEALLHRGCTAQKRWGDDGEVVEIPAEDEGVDPRLTRLILSEHSFDGAVGILESFSLVIRKQDEYGLKTLTLHPLVQSCMLLRYPSEVINRWKWQATLLICHAFPRSRYLDSMNGQHGRAQLLHVFRTVKEIPSMQTERSNKNWTHVISLLLAASRFSDMPFKSKVCNIAQELLKHEQDPVLNAWGAARTSAVLRIQGLVDDSDRVLTEFLGRTAFSLEDNLAAKNPRLNAFKGDLNLSFAENLIRKDRLAEAYQNLQTWISSLPDQPSAIERLTLRGHRIIQGKILRFQGEFVSALACLNNVLEESSIDPFYEGVGWYRVLISQISDLYCEMQQPEMGEQLIRRELSGMIVTGVQNIGSGRRLQLSLAETLICQRSFSEAQSVLSDLAKAYEEMRNDPRFEGDARSRMLICQARLYHLQSYWQDALDAWREALALAQVHGRQPRIKAALIQLSMAHVLQVLGLQEDSASMLFEARRHLSNSPRKYWIACFYSHWYDYISSCLQDAP